MAQETPFLMHAILGLAASSLSTRDHSLAKSVAVRHRQKALKGMHEAMCYSRDVPSQARVLDSLVAASYALAYQTCYLNDDFCSSIIFYRGISKINNLPIMTASRKSSMHTRLFQQPEFKAKEISHLIDQANIKSIDSRILTAAEDSLSNIHVFCADSPFLNEFYHLLLETIHLYRQSLLEGSLQVAKKFQWLTSISESGIKQLLNPDDVAALLLRAHWHVLDFLINRSEVLDPRATWWPAENTFARTEVICKAKILDGYGKYLRWPARVVGVLRAEQERKGSFSILDAFELVRMRPELFFYTGF